MLMGQSYLVNHCQSLGGRLTSPQCFFSVFLITAIEKTNAGSIKFIYYTNSATDATLFQWRVYIGMYQDTLKRGLMQELDSFESM